MNQRKSRRTKPPRRVTFTEATIGGVRGLWAMPETVTERTLLYLHGGGYCMGSPETYRALAGMLARRCRARVFVPDYRLAPEHPFPAALDDAQAVYAGLLAKATSVDLPFYASQKVTRAGASTGQQRYPVEQAIVPASIALVGDSAGAGLALALLLRLRDHGIDMPAAAVFLSGWFDLTFASQTYRTNAERDLSLYQPELEWFAGMYTGGDPANNPYISPIYADLHDLPPLLLHVGEDEVFFGENQQIAQNARQAGTPVTLQTWPNVPHVWHPFAPWLPEAAHALSEIATFLEAQRP